jgi:hypothetical protein
MFTTGSKLHVGLGVFATLTLVVVGVTTGGDLGRTAVVGLAAALIALALLIVINFSTRDATVDPNDTASVADAAACRRAPSASAWPMVGALGAGLIVVGLVTRPAFFKAGVVVLLATLVEWMVLGWSERASADPAYNASVRKRLLHPIEFPLLGAGMLAVIIYSFSRIMLFVSKSGSPAVFGLLAALVLLAGVLFAYRPNIKQSVAIGVSGIALVGLASTGVVMALDGQRAIDKHPTVTNDKSVCSSNDHTEVDSRASQAVSMKANIMATIKLQGGQLVASQIGVAGPLTTITVPRSNSSDFIFENDDPTPVRLVAHLGTYDETVNGKPVSTAHISCTTLVRQGGQQLITLKFHKSSRALASGDSFNFAVPGNTSSVITIEVP